MGEMINFGIDLGTTNSLVAKFNNGTVEVFKNPIGFKETLSSVVAFRNESIQVGDKAKSYLEKDPKNVFGSFKRKMGTTESFKIASLGKSITPIELSSYVLKELKTFVHTGEIPEAVVITIPASFDMVQSNATKQAGYSAGFKQVILLQEPIAASLAYANKESNVDLSNSQWIVYDLGGGTFDVALIKIVAGELKIIDHEGDNYLGGADYDELIVKRCVVPQLEKIGKFNDLLSQMTSSSGKYNRLWYCLLNYAETAKIELSAKTSAQIEFSVQDDEGKNLDPVITITRSEYENLIKDSIDKTAEMLRKILTRNSLRPQDLKFVLMVGGSTYTPFVRKRIEELLGIPVNTGIAPTNAIVVGAAYFAATKEISLAEKIEEKTKESGLLKLKASYNRASQESEEIFAAKVEGNVSGLFYRITREDGGYDSGLKQVSTRITEDLPLRHNEYNIFTFKMYDCHNNILPTDLNSIQIAQGKYSVAGQMLPEDLSLVIDDLATGDTKLWRIFAKNAILPTKAKKTVDVGKTIIHGSTDEAVRVIVVEGPSENHFTANKKQGELIITGKHLKRDLLRGTEIDLEFEISESRDLTVRAFINPSGPEFSQIYTPQARNVDVDGLLQEVQMIEALLKEERQEALTNENYEVVKKLDNLTAGIHKLRDETMILSLTPDDVTDERYKLDDRKRKVGQEIGQLTSGRRIERLRMDYQAAKGEVTQRVNENGNDLDRRQLHEIIVRESTFLNSTNPQKIDTEITQLRRLEFQILRRTPDFVIGWFEGLIEKRATFNDQIQAKNLIEAGKKHIAGEDYDRLLEVNIRLHSLLPQQEKDSKEMRGFTGIN